MTTKQSQRTATRRWGPWPRVLGVGVAALVIGLLWTETTGRPVSVEVGLAQGLINLAGIVLTLVGIIGLIMKRAGL